MVFELDSVIAGSGKGKGHKFVCCTIPRSKLKQSKTEAPTELLLVTIDETIVHLFDFGSYLSHEFKDDDPSLPPIENKYPSTSTTSCVDLQFINIVRTYYLKCNKFGIPSGVHSCYWFPSIFP